MPNNQFINLEELSKTTQALLLKINEQSNLKVNKNNVRQIVTSGTKIAEIENTEIYAPEIDTSNFITQDDLNLANVAYSGSYNDLDDTPSLVTVATSGDYNDLDNKPTIPTKISDLTNDSQLITNNIWIGTCNNEANIIAKSVTCNGFSLKSNQLIFITFQKGFEYTVLTGNTWRLNINNTGGKSIVDSQLLNCSPHSTLIFTYKNDQYECLGNITLTKTSELTNDSDYQTSTQINSAIATAIGNINQFEVATVTDLPTTDIDTHTIYFKSNSSSGNNVYDEYMYINNNWELIGSTAVDLSNYLQKTDIAEWAKQTNKPTYTANEVGALPSTYTPPVTAVNGETGSIIVSKIKTTPSDTNVEYNLIGTAGNNNTTAVSPYNQNLLSFAKTTDFSRLTIGSTSMPGKIRLYSSANSASGYTELKSNSSSTNTREVVFPDASGTVALTTDIPNIPSWALAASKPSYTFSELTSHPTTLNDYGITNAYTKTEVDGLVSGVLHYKGTKANVSALPSSGNIIGDVWHITADGSEWAWDGSDWQELGTAVDLIGYLQSSDIAAWAKAANKPSYTASEVGALPSNTNYVSSFNGQSGAITYVPPVSSVNGQTGVVELTIPSDTSDLTNGAGFLTSFTETDPTVPSWAKASTKPSYTASEVGAASTTHAHGSITSDGAITENTALASSDRLVFADNSDSGKLKRSSITFGSSTTQYLANNGTWQNVPSTYDDTALANRVSALEQIPWVTYYTGSSTPSNSQGNNGDLYFQTAQ